MTNGGRCELNADHDHPGPALCRCLALVLKPPSHIFQIFSRADASKDGSHFCWDLRCFASIQRSIGFPEARALPASRSFLLSFQGTHPPALAALSISPRPLVAQSCCGRGHRQPQSHAPALSEAARFCTASHISRLSQLATLQDGHVSPHAASRIEAASPTCMASCLRHASHADGQQPSTLFASGTLSASSDLHTTRDSARGESSILRSRFLASYLATRHLGPWHLLGHHSSSEARRDTPDAWLGLREQKAVCLKPTQRCDLSAASF